MKNNKSKRIVAGVLAVLTCLCLSTGALAAGSTSSTTNNVTGASGVPGQPPMVQTSGEMGQFPGAPNGMAMNFQPSGEMGQMPALPEGDAPADAPEMPNGQAPTGQPSGEMGQMPELPEGEAPADAPELPNGQAPIGQPSGEMPQNGNAPMEQNNIRGFIQQLINALQQLLGGNRNAKAPVQVSPTFEVAPQNTNVSVDTEADA